MHVIIADNNDLIRIGLREIISQEIHLAGLSEVRNKEELLSVVGAHSNAMILIDYTTKDFGIEVIPNVLQKNKHIQFIAITPEQSAATLVDAFRSGVRSYIKKDCDVQEIKDAVRETSLGNRFFCGKILETIHRSNINIDDLKLDAFTCDAVGISERENEIITLIAEGHTNEEIADKLFLSKHTVNTHRKNIMNKLGVKNTAGIVMYAVKMNLVSPNKFLFAPNY